MKYPEEKIRGALMGIITGDALGTPLEGMSRAHIGAIFKSMETYVDPEPAIAGRMERWRKPGLYSSISQITLILCLALGARRGDPALVLHRLLKEIPPVEDGDYGIFRHPGLMERHLLDPAGIIDNRIPYTAPCARMIPMAAPLSLVLNKPLDPVIDIIPRALIFNRDPLAVSGLLIFSSLLSRLASMGSDSGNVNLLALAILETENLRKEITGKSHIIFGLSLNPDTLLHAADSFLDILQKIERTAGRREAEAVICENLNRISGGHITRATINHPLAAFPFCLSVCNELLDRPGNILFSAVSEGGASHLIGSMCGALAGSLFGIQVIPDRLIQDLVNKKKIIGIVEELARGRFAGEMLRDFITSEAPLCAKEKQEIAAKIKHHPPKIKKSRSRKDMEKDLSRHIIESWTKRDKAKWKKEKKKRGINEEEK